MPQSSPWWKRLWDGLGHYGKLKTLWQLALSLYFTSTTVSVLPGGWHPPQYWAIAGFAFFGAWAVAATVTVGFQKLLSMISQWKNPPNLVVDAHGGDKGFVELKHTGAAATYWADGRIFETNDGSPNPAPALFQGQLIWKGHNASPNLLLRDGEWALVVIATIETDGFSRSWMVIRRGKYGHNTIVPDKGAIVELRIRSDAGYDETHRIRVVRVQLPDKGSMVNVTSV